MKTISTRFGCQAMLVVATSLWTSALIAGPLALSNVPLFMTTPQKGNVLLIMDNSNSMDENAAGAAVGSADPTSKSEIARSVAKNIVSTYLNKINLGLMAYQQASMSAYFLHNSPYDVSYNPANYDPAFTGARDALTKRFREPNPSSPGNYIHYNVALPFYASSNQGDAFCYSPTARAFSNGETYPTGPWDTYRCFSSKTGTSDTLPTWADAASEAAQGYSGLFYQGVFYPTDSDLAQGILDFGKQNTWRYVSPTWFANTSPGRGYLHTPVALLDSIQAGKLNTKLGTSQFVDNKPTDPAYPLQNAGLTPIEGTLLTAKDYFAGALSAANQGGPQPAPPNSCGKDFTVMITDGLPSTDQNGAVVTNPTQALSDAAAAAAALNAAKVKTYVVGFALPYGVAPNTLDTIAASGGTGTAYSASDYASLSTSLDAIFNNILAQIGSGSSVAASSGKAFAGSTLYQAKFDPSDWSGMLLALPVDQNGTIQPAAWNAGAKLTSAAGRQIVTYKRSTGAGIPFVWPANPASPAASELDAWQIAALDKNASGVSDGNGAARLDYLRGSAANEGTGLNFRTRSTTKLGDIIDSSPVYVAMPDNGYPSAIESSSYAAFRNANMARLKMVYVGANDGMLHGFNADDNDPTNVGKEKFAYVPTPVYSNLSQLTSATYAHRYFVDGTPSVADAYFGGAWHTVLAGGLNAGGQGIYALDVTNPAALSESNAGNIALWEFTDADDADLGYTFSRPEIVKMKNGKWAVVFGNGYNNTNADGAASTTGHAVLYIAFINDGLDGTWTLGSDYIKITTKKGTTTTPNGLASLAPVDVNNDFVIDTIYAGDLLGNMWKFDVTSSNPSQWKVAYGTASTPAPLFTAKDASNNPQPITSRPEVGKHPNGGYMVYFGTGKYLETGDVADTGAQSFYGIWDDDAAVGGRSDLLQQTVTGTEFVTASGETSEYRKLSKNPVNWCGTGSCHKGWFIDFPESGERQFSGSSLRTDVIQFVTNTPSSAVCKAGGTSWFMKLDRMTGGEPAKPAFDVNGDGLFTTADRLASGANAAGKRLNGIAAEPTKVGDHDVISTSDGKLHKPKSTPVLTGRISWREIR